LNLPSPPQPPAAVNPQPVARGRPLHPSPCFAGPFEALAAVRAFHHARLPRAQNPRLDRQALAALRTPPL
jgi:hypothetical protein